MVKRSAWNKIDINDKDYCFTFQGYVNVVNWNVTAI